MMTGLRVWGAFGRFVLLPLLAQCTLICVLIPDCLSHPQPCQILKRIGHTVRVGALHLQPRMFTHDASTGKESADEWDIDGETREAAERELEKITKSINEHGLRSLRTRGSAYNQYKGAKSKNMYQHVENESRVFMPRDSILLAMETLNRMVGLLPYNLSLEVVMAVEAGLGELPAFSFASSSTPVCEDPMSFLESVCHTVIVQGVSAVVAFPQTRDELVKLEFIASALQIPVISVVQNEFKRQSKVGKYFNTNYTCV